MKVIDNFLPNDIHQQFVDLLMSNDFPYYFIDGVANINGTEDDFIFFHNLYGNPHNFNHSGGEIVSRYFNMIAMPLLGRLNFNNLLRARVNLYTRKHEGVISDFHQDLEERHTVALYNINSNNGVTVFKTGEKLPSVANQMIIFDGKLDHAVIPQTDTKLRVNINLNIL
jgi:hypothetical protein|tara:strand:- start:141 stop:647 length:507 start_codon:yes stop_codon:yes gene_type:complete